MFAMAGEIKHGSFVKCEYDSNSIIKYRSCLGVSLQWRHNGRDSVSNHQPFDYLLNRLFRRRPKKIPKLRVTGLCVGNSPVAGEFPAQMASDAENVSIWWHHHVFIRDKTFWHYIKGVCVCMCIIGFIILCLCFAWSVWETQLMGSLVSFETDDHAEDNGPLSYVPSTHWPMWYVAIILY